ncbi:uncharacterized protein BCR38DRAFT_72427 [Pseudomassariella vexata]|uniref:Glycoside hydrolase superfamily n=1 Tax=Pseudomassariella vexata TaxID=1141098 RepID=A0A1Y2DGG4_9PEZI|nr:uncharacterized protein BCR38DRAFT_72427 [Pseudomassariella vexata]ORY58380.1 hypothetical protein BCR38DRAFT_72427 [Pseudomassariella vexata]
MHGFGCGGLALLALLPLTACAQDLWCGKVYTAGTPEIIPGGRLEPPKPSTTPLLDLQVTPRHSIYVGSEEKAEFIVDATLSYIHGTPYLLAVPNGTYGGNASDILFFTIETEGRVLVSDTIVVNKTNKLLEFDLAQLTPRMSAYQIDLSATSRLDESKYTVSTELFFLPDKTVGSVVKVDNLYGSLLYRNEATRGSFKPVFPYGFYADYSGYLNVSNANVEAYASKGFNAINPVADFTDGNMTLTIDRMDELNLLFQYDMRNSFQNLTSVAEQVPLVKDHPSLLTWYTADEPDGWVYNLNSTKLTYDLLVSLDKYHPTALVLNCQNYYYAEYSSGADIIMEDAYPVGINATYSRKWNTPVNETYGDAGCDNCVGSLLDVPYRIDDLYSYQKWIGGAAARKPIWAVPQAFSGESYWERDPTPAEVWVMDMLAFNHGAKGRFAWIYPPSDMLVGAASQLAQVVTVSPVMDFLTGANPVFVQDDKHGLDVSYWSLGAQVLVGIVNPRNTTASPVQINLPDAFTGLQVESEPWGEVGWSLDGSSLIADNSLAGLATSYVLLN